MEKIMKSGCLIIIFFYALIYFITDEEHYKVTLQEPDYPEYTLDTTREAVKFDWDKMDYIYRDQLPIDTNPVYTPPPMPDYYVAPMPQQGKPRSLNYEKETQILKGGKRYRVNVLPDGTLQLIPIR